MEQEKEADPVYPQFAGRLRLVLHIYKNNWRDLDCRMMYGWIFEIKNGHVKTSYVEDGTAQSAKWESGWSNFEMSEVEFGQEPRWRHDLPNSEQFFMRHTNQPPDHALHQGIAYRPHALTLQRPGDLTPLSGRIISIAGKTPEYVVYVHLVGEAVIRAEEDWHSTEVKRVVNPPRGNSSIERRIVWLNHIEFKRRSEDTKFPKFPMGAYPGHLDTRGAGQAHRVISYGRIVSDGPRTVNIGHQDSALRQMSIRETMAHRREWVAVNYVHRARMWDFTGRRIANLARAVHIRVQALQAAGLQLHRPHGRILLLDTVQRSMNLMAAHTSSRGVHIGKRDPAIRGIWTPLHFHIDLLRAISISLP